MKRRVKTLGAIASLLLVLFLAFNLAYRLGADGLRVSGSAVSFGRGHDRQLLRVNDTSAVLIDRFSTNELAIVDVTPPPFPFNLLCGAHQPDGFARNADAARAVFGDKLEVKPHPVAGARNRVLVKMTVEEAMKTLQPLSTCNESCLTFNAAFVLLFVLLGMIAPVAWWRSRKA